MSVYTWEKNTVVFFTENSYTSKIVFILGVSCIGPQCLVRKLTSSHFTLRDIIIFCYNMVKNSPQ